MTGGTVDWIRLAIISFVFGFVMGCGHTFPPPSDCTQACSQASLMCGSLDQHQCLQTCWRVSPHRPEYMACIGQSSSCFAIDRCDPE